MPVHNMISGCLAGLLLLACAPTLALQEVDIDQAIERGLAWIREHPATPGDGGFRDMVDEVLFYRTVSRMDTGHGDGSPHEQALAESRSRLAASIAAKRKRESRDPPLFRHYHLLLASHLAGPSGIPAAVSEGIVESAQDALARDRSGDPSFRVTVALLIRHLGAEPRVSLDGLLEASLVNRIAVRGTADFPFRREVAYYALIHEVAALTDFGAMPVTPWLLERRDGLARIIGTGLELARASSHIDLLAELLLFSRMLDLPVSKAQRDAVAFLVGSQHPDGTWGPQITLRQNRVRHAVQTATAALLAYRKLPLGE